MATQSDLNVIWECSICTYENQSGNDLCEMCGAKKPNNPAMWQCNKCGLFNFNKKRCKACFNEPPPLNVAQIIHLLIQGYLRNANLRNSIIEINSLIQKFYACHDTNPHNFITTMMIDYKCLNDVVEIFSNQQHGVMVKTGSTSSAAITSEMIYFSLQSQTRHLVKCAHRYNWEFWNGNLISLRRIDTENYQSTMYNIASNTIYPIPQFLSSDRGYVGCCISAKRGIFSIGGYFHDKDIDAVNAVHNVRWNWNDSKLKNWNVTQLASYWHDTWSSTPLFIDNDNKVVNIGGGEGRCGHCSQIVGLYDFETNKWSRLADIPYHSQSSGAYYNKFDETIYVNGGYACDTRSCVCYSAHTNQWNDIGQTNWSYESPCVSVINNSIVLVINGGKQVMNMEYLDIRTPHKKFTVLVGTDANMDNRWKGGKSVSYDLVTNKLMDK